MISSYISKFPDKFTPTPVQVDVITRIEQAFESGKKFVVCCAPTGSGKSFVAKTFDGVSKPPTEKFKELINNHGDNKPVIWWSSTGTSGTSGTSGSAGKKPFKKITKKFDPHKISKGLKMKKRFKI